MPPTPSINFDFVVCHEIKIDGIADESVWGKAKFNSDFWEYFPLDSIKAKHYVFITNQE